MPGPHDSQVLSVVFKKYPSKHFVAVLASEHVSAPVIHDTAQAPSFNNLPELHVREVSPEQVLAFAGQAKHYPFTN